MSDALTPQVRAAMDASAREGLEWHRKGLPARAIAEWRRGYAMVPVPRSEHPEAAWFEGNIGSCLVEVGRYAEGRTLLKQAIASAEGNDNPHLHVAAGVAAHELGELDEARGYFIRAFRLGGESVFDGYDPVYADSIATVIALERDQALY